MSFVIANRERGKNFVQAVLANEAAALAEKEAEINRRVRQEITKLRAAAEAEGHKAGYEAGLAAMEPEREAMTQAIRALREAYTQLATPLAEKQTDLAELVTDLSFTLATHIIGVEATSNPHALQTLLDKLLAEAAAERTPKQSLLVRLNPSDHVRIAPNLHIENTHLLPDAAISPGGAIAELFNPAGDPLDKIEWNATVEGRISAVRSALGLGDVP
jgi:flagellar assembly protein FliH